MNYVVFKRVANQSFKVFFETKSEAMKEFNRLKSCGVDAMVLRNSI